MFMELSHLIGRGSHGSVYKGRWNNKDVAIKQIRRSPDMARIHHEIQLIRTFHCPNIVKYHTVIYDSTYAYIIMDLIDGTNALDLMKDSIKFPAFTKTFLQSSTRALTQSLQCIQSHGYIYNDMKPSNLMIDMNTGDVHIVDLGSTVQLPTDRLIHRPLGTPYFFSPEKITWNYSTPADVWALGITLFMMASGEHPIIPPNITKLNDLEFYIMEAPIHLTHPSILYYGPEFQDLLRHMLQRDTARRMTFSDILQHPWIQDYPADV